MGRLRATEPHSSTQVIKKLNLPRMMFEKMPMLMVLTTLLYLACSVYGGTKCLEREGLDRHEDCLSLFTVGAQRRPTPSVCTATHCTAGIIYPKITYCCGEKFQKPIVEGQGSAKTTCTCEQMKITKN